MRSRLPVLSRERLIDELVDAYVDWRDACARVSDTYRFWACETHHRDRVAFGLYVAALDAEEHAADVYGALVQRAYTRLWGGMPASEARGKRAPGVGSS